MISQTIAIAKSLDSLTVQETINFKKYSEQLRDLFTDLLTDKYSISYNFIESAAVKNAGEAIKELVQFLKIKSRNINANKKREMINKWVKSDAHALFIYDQLVNDQFSYDSKEMLNILTKKNPHFLNVDRLNKDPGTLITYSFEKESSHADITMMYKDPKISDEDWLELAPQIRLGRLKRLTQYPKEKMASEQIAPTGLKPHQLGGYSEEISDAEYSNYMWEVSSKRYSLDRKDLFEGIKQVSEITQETFISLAHSF